MASSKQSTHAVHKHEVLLLQALFTRLKAKQCIWVLFWEFFQENSSPEIYSSIYDSTWGLKKKYLTCIQQYLILFINTFSEIKSSIIKYSINSLSRHMHYDQKSWTCYWNIFIILNFHKIKQNEMLQLTQVTLMYIDFYHCIPKI